MFRTFKVVPLAAPWYGKREDHVLGKRPLMLLGTRHRARVTFVLLNVSATETTLGVNEV